MRNNFNTLSQQEETSVNHKKKIAAGALAVVGLFGAGCSNEGSATSGGGLFGGGREVIAGNDCSQVENVYTVGTYSPFNSDGFEPFPGGTPHPEGVALRDGNWYNNDTYGTLVDIGTLSPDQADQLKASYELKVEQINQVKESYDIPAYQDGYIVLYGKELADVAESSPADGVIDDEDLQVCVYAYNGHGGVGRGQFVR